MGVRLRQHVVAVDLGEDCSGRVLGHAPAARPRQEALPLPGDELGALRPGEGPPQRIRLRRTHAGHVHDQLDHLFLPGNDALGALDGARLQRVVVAPGGAVPVAGDELGDGAALHAHAGPDESHLVGQVLQAAGAQAPGDLELGGRLQEEDALGPAFIGWTEAKSAATSRRR